MCNPTILGANILKDQLVVDGFLIHQKLGELTARDMTLCGTRIGHKAIVLLVKRVNTDAMRP